MTPNLSDERRCTANSKRSGERCKKPAMHGAKTCATHGSANRVSRAAAERRLARAEAEKLVRQLLVDPDAAPVLNPAWELSRIAGRMGHAVDVLGERVNELDAAGRLEYSDANMVRRLHVLAEAWRDLMVEYRRTLTEMTRLKIEALTAAQLEERVQELYGEAIARAIQRILDGLHLSAEQWARVPEVVPAVLREVGGGG